MAISLLFVRSEALSYAAVSVSANRPREGVCGGSVSAKKADCRERDRHALGNVITTAQTPERRNTVARCSDLGDSSAFSSRTSVDECRQPASVRDDAAGDFRTSSSESSRTTAVSSGSGRRRFGIFTDALWRDDRVVADRVRLASEGRHDVWSAISAPGNDGLTC